MARGWDEEPCDGFFAELPGRPVMFGGWRPQFAPNGNDFDVEIASFGYLGKQYLGSEYPSHRRCLSIPEEEALERLVRALFSDQVTNAWMVPFTSRKAKFLGGVYFAPGWILREP